MSLELIIQVATLLSVILGVCAFFWGINSYKMQMNAQVFIEYTKRFETVMESFPQNSWAMRLNTDEALPDPSVELSTSVLRYLNLCSEEYYLCERGYYSRQIWGIWEDELKRMLRAPLFRREWQKLAREFESYPAFRAYVEETQRQSP